MAAFLSLVIYMGMELILMEVPSLKCMPLLGYEMQVYPVSSCPKNDTEWQKASRKRGCSEKAGEAADQYHCLPIHDLSQLGEFCYDKLSGLVQPGLCMILSQSSLLDERNCTMFASGCPDEHYIPTVMYKFPACLEIIGSSGCYSADPTCRTTIQSPNTTSTSEGTNIDKKMEASIYFSTATDHAQMGVAITFGILGPFLVLSALILVHKTSYWLCRQRRKNGEPDSKIKGEQDHTSIDDSNETTPFVPKESPKNQNAYTCRRRSKEIPESGLEALTKRHLEKHKADTTYVKTLAVEVALRCLKEEHIIIVTGKEGAGKSKLAFQVIHCLLNEKAEEKEEGIKFLKLESKNEWRENVNIGQPYIVLLDDVVSLAKLSTTFDETINENVTKSFLDDILCGAEHGKIYSIIVCRQKELEELRTLLPAHELFNPERHNCIIDISSSYTLTKDEKRRMLIKHAQKNERKINEENLEEILNIDTFFGFPYTCFLFFSLHDFFILGPDFFRGTNKKLFGRIDNLRKIGAELKSKISYFVLCYVFEKGVIKLSNDCLSELLKEISGFLDIGNSGITYSDFKDAVKGMKGTYLVETKDKSNVYAFSHDAVRETVCISFGDFAPERVIETCPWKTLNTVVKIESYEEKPQELVLKIPKQYYEPLAKRFLVAEFDEETIAKNIILSGASSDPEFVRILLTRVVPRMSVILRELWDLLITDKKSTLLKLMLEIYGPHTAVFNQKTDGSINFRIDRPEIDSLMEKCVIFQKDDKLLNIIKYVKEHLNLQEIASSKYTIKKQKMSLLQFCEKNGWEDILREF